MIAACMFGRITLQQPLPPGGAVDLGRLEHVLGDLREPGQQQQRHERRGLPDLGDHDREHRRPVAAEPVGVRPIHGSQANQPLTKPLLRLKANCQANAETTVMMP